MPARCSDWMRVALCLLLALAAAGCSVRLAYDNAPRLAVWQAGEYVDLDRRQKNWLRQRMRVFMHWHRTEQLPYWVSVLTEFEAVVQDEVTADYLDALSDRTEQWWEAALVELQPIAVELLLDLDEEQLAELPFRFAERNDELNEDYAGLEDAEQRAVWREETREFLDRWIGALTPEQERLLLTTSETVTPDNAAWVAYRVRWQGALLEILADREDPDRFAERFAALIAERESYWTEDYASLREQNDPHYQAFTMGLLSSLDGRQRRRLGRRLEGLIEDFSALAADVGPAPEAPPALASIQR